MHVHVAKNGYFGFVRKSTNQVTDILIKKFNFMSYLNEWFTIPPDIISNVIRVDNEWNSLFWVFFKKKNNMEQTSMKNWVHEIKGRKLLNNWLEHLSHSLIGVAFRDELSKRMFCSQNVLRKEIRFWASLCWEETFKIKEGVIEISQLLNFFFLVMPFFLLNKILVHPWI